MSINFSTLKGLSIPEGNVTQIADAAGNVLWSAVKNVVITITGGSNSYTYVVIDGVTYNTETAVEVPIGTVITCVTHNSNFGGTVKLNYEKVADSVSSGVLQYEYLVVSDATIRLEVKDPSGYGYALRGEISIIDKNAPEGCVVTITTTGGYNAGASVKIDGDSYSTANTIEVSIGTVITCSAQYSSGMGGTVSVNGETVSQGGGDYDYTVNSDVEITIGKYRKQTGQSTYIVYGTISITEL